MKIALSVAFLFCAVVSQAAQNAAIPSDELRRIELMREPGLAVVDVRPFEEYAKGHIQGSKSIQAKDVGTAGLGKRTSSGITLAKRTAGPECTSGRVWSS